ncbi:MAG: M15 family metallopeptidase [Bacteroidetes bacterium]|nr:M15 family metallopeptidase [Bacteroidota bacterium]MBL6943207.1 M15 family metallopeptidase [Bacteroidales bacterium]
MYLQKHQQEFAMDVAKLIQKASKIGVQLTLGEAYRTIDQQLLYYHGLTIRSEDRRLELLSSKQRSRTLVSNHMRRIAVDFNFFVNGVLTYTDPLIEELGQYWENLNPLNQWGGHFRGFYDAPHFERNLSK